MDRIKLLEELWAVVDAPPGVDVAKYSQVEYFAIRHKLATYKQHAQKMLKNVARCQAITAEDIIAAAPPSLAYNEALEVWEYTPLGRAAHDPAEYRAAVCKTLAAAMTKHYIATGRFMGHRGVPWQEFGISIARAWFNYDRRKFDGGGGAPYKGRAVEEDAVSFINGDVSTVKKRLKGSSSRTATVARWLKEYAPAELEPFLRMMSK